jgi:hypothetical protein
MVTKEQILSELEEKLNTVDLNYFKELFGEYEWEMGSLHKETLLTIFTSLEFQEPYELIENIYNDKELLKKVMDMYTLKVKSMMKQFSNLQREREDLFDRKDMIEFAEYVAKTYTLREDGWTLIDNTDKIQTSSAQMLNEFELDKHTTKEIDFKSNKDGKEIARYIYG